MASARKTPFLMLSAAVGVSLLLSVIAGLMGGPSQSPGGSGMSSVQAQQPGTVRTPQWAATAPGRVEPRSGEIRISAQAAGRITELGVGVNDAVKAGDLLLRLDDDDARARLAAADAEAAVRRRERDAEASVNRLAADRRQAEDTVFASERSVLIAKTELDRVMREQRAGRATVDDVAKERAALKTAVEKLDADRAVFRKAQTAAGIPLPTRLEAGLTASRADVALAEQALERTRVRAPIDGTVLQLIARLGETVGPSPEQILMTIGDMSALRVRAEVEERDVSKIKVGQAVVLRSDAFPGREFTGRVASRAQALGPAKLGQRGPRRPTDVDTLEVLIDVDAGSALLPGLRVDVYFRIDAEKPQAAAPAPAPAPMEPPVEKAAEKKDAQPPATPAPATTAPQAATPEPAKKN